MVYLYWFEHADWMIVIEFGVSETYSFENQHSHIMYRFKIQRSTHLCISCRTLEFDCIPVIKWSEVLETFFIKTMGCTEFIMKS